MPEIWDKHVTERQNIQRITLIGPMSQGQAIMKALHDAGWRLTYSGPYSNRKMFPKVDMNQFHFIAERELEL